MEKLKLKNDNLEMTRLSVITLLTASMFGVLQYFGDKTFESLGIDVLLKTFALVLFKIPFLIFMIYLFLLGVRFKI